MDCPRCRLANPPEAQRCDCGYDFASRRVTGSYLTSKDRLQITREAEAQQGGMRALGVLSRLFQLFGLFGR